MKDKYKCNYCLDTGVTLRCLSSEKRIWSECGCGAKSEGIRIEKLTEIEKICISNWEQTK